MIRWGIALIVAIYVILLVIPDADQVADDTRTTGGLGAFFSSLLEQAESGASRPPPADLAPDDLAESDALQEVDGTYRLQTADGEWLEVAAVINPFEAAAGEQDRDIALITVGATGVEAPEVSDDGQILEVAAEAPPATNTEIWRVTGDRVNFRAGPSTNNPILTALVRGDQVEYLADAPDDWAQLRVLATGQIGYMAVRFLERVN